MFLFFSTCCRRFSSTIIDLGGQMKRLNDNRQFQKSLALFEAHMANQPNAFTVNQALKACIQLGEINRGIAIYQNLSSSLINNHFIQANLIHLYLKSGDYPKAKETFQKNKKSSTICVALLNGLIEGNQAKEAFNLYQQMDISPDQYLISVLFKICAHLGDTQSLEYGKKVFNNLPIKFKSDVILVNSAIRMFIRCGDISNAEQVFLKMKKDSFSYSIMMNGFISHGMPKKAIDLFFKIPKVDEVIYTTYFTACAQLGTDEGLVLGKQVFEQLPIKYCQLNDLLISVFDMFIKCNDIESAESLFPRLKKSVVSHGSLMKMYNINDQPEKTLALFEQMKKEEIDFNEIIFILLIDACSLIGNVSVCEWIISQIPPDSMNNNLIQSSLIDMWAKAGSVDKAKEIFQGINQPDDICLAIMINTYALNGMGMECVQFFHQIPMNMLNESIYICVLNGCSHCGLINEAREIFDKIPLEKRTEKIYTARIDGLNRSSEFDKAEALILEFERLNPPSVVMYMSMLSAARNQKDPALSQKYFDRIEQLFPEMKDYLLSAIVLLANTYASAGNLTKAAELRGKIGQSGRKKTAGLSWTMVDGKIRGFRAHDRSHPQWREIYEELDCLNKDLVGLC